jgi:type II secretory pathway pseudopilin PulG
MKLFQKLSKGFSLVETVLAVGLMAFAITALLGLLPHGIEMSRKAGVESAIVRIVDTVRSDLQRMPWSALPAGADNVQMAFDDQGLLIGPANPGAGLQAFAVLVDFAGPNNNQITFPGGAGVEPLSLNFVIHVADTGDLGFSFARALTLGNRVRSFPILVAPVRQ